MLRQRSAHVRLASICLMVLTALVALGTGVHAQATAEPVDNPYFEEGAAPGGGVGKRIGYISLGDGIPFVDLVTASIAEQAAVAGVDLYICSARNSFNESISCARQLAEAGVQGVLNFQPDAHSSAEICAAYGDLPTIAIDIHQRPCEVAYMGVDNHRAGFVVGSAMGDHVLRERDCAYDSVIVMDAGSPGETTRDRMSGSIDGFAEVCGPIPDDRLFRFEVMSGVGLADESMTTFLQSVPAGGTHILFAVHGEAAIGALRAATALGRPGEVWVGAQGADPTSRYDIACDPRWVADAAYFPERYGRTLIPAMIDILDGTEVPAELYTPHVAVTSQNIRELYPDIPACE